MKIMLPLLNVEAGDVISVKNEKTGEKNTYRAVQKVTPQQVFEIIEDNPNISQIERDFLITLTEIEWRKVEE